MARRYQRIFLQCPQYDGTNPPGKEMPSRAEQMDKVAELDRLNTRWWAWPPEWRPLHCEFHTLDANGQPTNNRPIPGEGIYATFDADDKEPYQQQYRCTRHNVHPIIWARHYAWERRTRVARNSKYRAERVQGPVNGRFFTIYVPNRPDPITLSNQWNTLATPETRQRRRRATTQ